MKIRTSRAFVAMMGAALVLGCAVSSVRAADSNWYAPVAQAQAAGALKPQAVTAAPMAAPQGGPRLLLMKGIQLMHGKSKAHFGVQAAPQLQYFGGPLLGNVQIQLVYWNKDVMFQDKLPGFYSAITQSAYFDWLTEYNSPTTTIGRGSYAGSYTDSVAIPKTAQIEDADIQTELSSLIAKKAVPQPGANTLYMVYFPPGLNIDQGGQGSCQVFCAYHNTFLNNGTQVQYGVIPDQGGNCTGGCGGDPDQFNNETSVSSHEMIESVTDPAVGLMTSNTPGAPMGWYDSTNGEIGDICNAVQAKVGAYTVQREWSNARGLCVATAQDAGAPFTPAGP